jgi:hypothetical protein
MQIVHKAIGVSGVMFYGLFSPILALAQEADDLAELPAAIQQSESGATSSVLRDVNDLGADAENALKNEAEKDFAQIKDVVVKPTVGPTPQPTLDDSLSSIEADEISLEAQADALKLAK